MKTPIFRQSEPSYELPEPMCTQIGRIVVRWAYVEYLLQKTIYSLADVDDDVGRLAIREPRATDRLDLINDLATLQGAKLPSQTVAQLKSHLQTIGERRDLVAHSIWTQTGDGWRLISTRGNHPKDRKLEVSKRKVAPEALEVNAAALTSIANAIEEVIESIRSLRGALKAKL